MISGLKYPDSKKSGLIKFVLQWLNIGLKIQLIILL